ncbi:MAG TPA: TonB family protein [Casimicrobiaceae bacterium]|nr:TonB family protein [Casimicrobiaceae bacterium]
MDFARQQRDPTRHLIGIAFVVALHALVVWAMVSGLGRKAIEVIKKPITATIIEEIKVPPPPPPPPPPKRVVLPKEAPPPPEQPYVPPPEVPVTPPPTPAPVISVAPSPEPPRQEYKIEPPAPPVAVAPPAPPAPPKPAVRRGVVPVSREDPVYPRAAIRAGIEKGRVLARVNIDEKGNVTDVIIVSADPPRHFDSSVRDALMKWKFKAEGEKYVGEIEVVFTLRD